MNNEHNLFSFELTDVYKGVEIFLALSGYGLAVSYNKNGLDNYWILDNTTCYVTDARNYAS